MFCKKVNIILEILHATNTDIAHFGNCTPSNISRLKSGARQPKITSPTVSKFIDGVYGYATSNNLIMSLCMLCDIDDSLTDTDFKKELLSWLYSSSEFSIQIEEKNEKFLPLTYDSFGRKLGMLMDLAEISNIQLSKTVNVDPSYISLFRNGKRTPKSNPQLLENICAVLVTCINNSNRLPELSKLINIPTYMLKNDESIYLLIDWLNDDITDNNNLVEDFLYDINMFSMNLHTFLPDYSSIINENILNDTQKMYKGTIGLQKAVTRFLGNAIKNNSKEILLYSDQNMNWMTDEYSSQWMSLMQECIRHNIKIKIIHNIDRIISEMFSAIHFWLPLYMSGMVESYYCTRKCGERFSHTLFLNPENSCIRATCVKGTEEFCNYFYHTDKENLSYFHTLYESLLKNSLPLVNTSTSVIHNNYFDYCFENIAINITDNSIIIKRTDTPLILLELTHPLMYMAFKKYYESNYNM